MAGFILGTGSGVLAAAATYYTLSAHLHRDTDVLREELSNTSRVIDTSFNPSQPAAPVAYIGPSRNPYEPTFGEQLRLKWNRAVEAGLDNVRETDWTAVGAGVVQGGKDIVGRLNGEVHATTSTTPSAHLPSGSDMRQTLNGAKEAVYRGEKKAEVAAANALESVQDGATTAGRSVANSSASLLDRLTGAFTSAKSRTDDAVASAKKETDHLASQAKGEAQHLSSATSDAAHRTADAARDAYASAKSRTGEAVSAAEREAEHLAAQAKGEARHLSSAASDAAHRAAEATRNAGLSVRDEARHLSHLAEDAASRASSSVRDAAQAVHDKISPPPPSAAQRLYDSVASTFSSTAHKVEDVAHKVEHAVENKAEEMKRATDNKVNHMLAEKQMRGVEEYHEGILKGTSGPGVTSATGVDLDKESFTGGSSLGVRARRKAEGTVAGRLV